MAIDQELYKTIAGRYKNPLNKIKNYSVQIVLDIYEDLTGGFDEILIISNTVINPRQLKSFEIGTNKITYSTSWDKHDKEFDFIYLDLSLNFSDDLPMTLNYYERLLKPGGIFIANVLGGKTLQELSSSMMEGDLRENRMVTRMLPKICAEGLLSISRHSSFKSPIVMSNETVLVYNSIGELIQSLREIGQVYPMAQADHPYTTKHYWETVEEIYRRLYGLRASFEFITLFAVK
jgi:hypothetical protein